MNNKQRKPKNSSDFELRGLKVEVRNNDVGKALRRFKKLVQDDGILQEVRNKEFYEKPSVIKNRKKKAARARHLKDKQKRFNDQGY